MNKGDMLTWWYFTPPPPCDTCVLRGDCKRDFTACVSFASYALTRPKDWFANYDRLTPNREIYERLYGRQT